MHNTHLVAVVQRISHLRTNLQSILNRQGPLGSHQVAEGTPIQALHHNVGQNAVIGGGFAGVVDSHNVGVVEAGAVAGFTAEALQEVVITC